LSKQIVQVPNVMSERNFNPTKWQQNYTIVIRKLTDFQRHELSILKP